MTIITVMCVRVIEERGRAGENLGYECINIQTLLVGLILVPRRIIDRFHGARFVCGLCFRNDCWWLGSAAACVCVCCVKQESFISLICITWRWIKFLSILCCFLGTGSSFSWIVNFWYRIQIASHWKSWLDLRCMKFDSNGIILFPWRFWLFWLMNNIEFGESIGHKRDFFRSVSSVRVEVPCFIKRNHDVCHP